MIDTTTFYLILYSTDLVKKVARITSNSVNLSTVPFKYHEFTDILSKAKIETLASHHSYNLQIKLENKCYCYLSSYFTNSFSYIKKLTKLAK